VRLGVLGLGEASAWFDTHVIDAAVNDVGWLTRLTATISSWWDKWIIDGLFVKGVAYSTIPFSWLARLFEWGLVQWYALVMTAGLVGFVFYYVYH
ncbi:MAG TPA: NADH-quinone oxidoreductase subunit L, partial [Verrucomicrobiae bacterium]|nr:NADH-quinone oxidoreductase subunit L [Verrucomicrobiae bacterium]